MVKLSAPRAHYKCNTILFEAVIRNKKSTDSDTKIGLNFTGLTEAHGDSHLKRFTHRLNKYFGI